MLLTLATTIIGLRFHNLLRRRSTLEVDMTSAEQGPNASPNHCPVLILEQGYYVALVSRE
jgi:hypothetical protein